MNHAVITATLAALLGGSLSGAALAGTADSQGGLVIQSDDGSFEGKVGGRIHYDGNVFVDDEDAEQTGGTFFRRARLTFSGKAYGWEYKFENDFVAQGASSGSGFKDMYIANAMGPGELRFGQFKPFRGLEELTSSNELSVMERGFATASGILGQQFVSGTSYQVTGAAYSAGLSLYTLNGAGSSTTEGTGTSVRVTFAPVSGSGQAVHLGAWASLDNAHNGASVGSSSVRYAGRLGPSQAIGGSVADGDRTMYGVEAGAAVGPFFAQAEYVQATLGQAPGASDQDVRAYYVMASWHVTGETKGYKEGAFRSVKPAGASGALELVLKQDFIENADSAAAPEATATTVGLNWYVNPSVRFMLNYVMGEAETAAPSTTQIDTLAARAQFSF